MKSLLFAGLMLGTSAIAAAQLHTQDYYVNVHATYVEASMLPNGSFDLQLGKVYHFDPEGRMQGKPTEPVPIWKRGGIVGRCQVTDKERGVKYHFAPYPERKDPLGFGIIVKENLSTGETEQIEYKDSDIADFRKNGYSASSYGYMDEQGRAVFIITSGGTTVLGPEKSENRFNNFLKIYTFDPSDNSIEESVYLTNKIPIAMTEESLEETPESMHAGEILGKIGDKLFVVYDYSEGQKETKKRTIDIWSLDLKTLEETEEYSKTYELNTESSQQTDMSFSSDPEVSGLMYYITDEKADQQKNKGAAYHIVWVTPKQEIVPVELDIPTDKLVFKGTWPPFLNCHVTAEQASFCLIAENNQSRDMLIINCENDGQVSGYETIANCDLMWSISYGLFFDERVKDLAEEYKNVVYENKDKSCRMCAQYKTASYFVDENNVAHLYIVEYLTPTKCPDMNDCVIKHAHIRSITKQL